MVARAFSGACALALAGLVPGALAKLGLNNWCGNEVTIVQSHNGGCDFGTDGRCISEGSQPWRMAPGSGQSLLWLDFITDGIGTSVKVGKSGSQGVLQFEYNVVQGQWGGLYWDLSDLDGSGHGLVGTPFRNDNVKVTPTGNGYGQGTCVVIRCAAGQVCLDSYQHPDDPNTKWCPVDTGDIWLDLCMPGDKFNSFVARDTTEVNETEMAENAVSEHDRRHMHFGAHRARRHVLNHKH